MVQAVYRNLDQNGFFNRVTSCLISSLCSCYEYVLLAHFILIKLNGSQNAKCQQDGWTSLLIGLDVLKFWGEFTKMPARPAAGRSYFREQTRTSGDIHDVKPIVCVDYVELSLLVESHSQRTSTNLLLPEALCKKQTVNLKTRKLSQPVSCTTAMWIIK